MDKVADDKEVHEFHGFIERAIHHEVRLVPFAKLLWKVEREAGKQGDCPKYDDWQMRPQTLTYECCDIVDEEHLQQYPSEPVATLGRTLHAYHESFAEVMLPSQHYEGT